MKTDPNKKFVVRDISRSEIADLLNNIISAENLETDSFTDDDERLTDAVCQDIALMQNDCIDDSDDLPDLEYKACIDYVKGNF